MRHAEKLEIHPDLRGLNKILSDEERRKRYELVTRTRLLLSTALGYPNGLPNLGSQPVQTVFGFDGFDEYMFARVYTYRKGLDYSRARRSQLFQHLKGPLILAIHIRKITVGLREINTMDEHLAVAAFQGNGYSYEEINGTVVPYSDDVREYLATNGSEFNHRNGNYAYIPGMFTRNLRMDEAVQDTFEDIRVRQKIAESVLPILESSAEAFQPEESWSPQ